VSNENQTDIDQCPVADSDEFGNSVPVIDIGGLTNDSSSLPAESAINEIASASREWGFFQIVNHGIPQSLIDREWQQTRKFFAQPMQAKEAILRTRENPWGYYNNELTKNQRDKKEVFDFTTDGADSIYAAENRWPEGMDEFRAVMREYLLACTKLSLQLLQAFCVGLKLPADFMHHDFATNHTGFIRLNYYPVKDPLEGTDTPHQAVADKGVHHHTDAGALTVLMQDDVGGLQVYKNGYWHNIPPVEGAIVINTGDMMQVWSNDYYHAAMHRVRAMEACDRYSIPFFFNPSASTRVDPLPTVVSDARPGRYRSIEWAEYRGKRTDGDYADYGTEVQISQFKI
jgi:isopenicillin N synthase-like dioxygenase